MGEVLLQVFVLAIINQRQGHLHAGNRPWKPVEGGMHWCVESSYQVPPNIHTKCVLLSECHWVAMWLSNISVLFLFVSKN